jgi:hypothetical protein
MKTARNEEESNIVWVTGIFEHDNLKFRLVTEYILVTARNTLLFGLNYYVELIIYIVALILVLNIHRWEKNNYKRYISNRWIFIWLYGRGMEQYNTESHIQSTFKEYNAYNNGRTKHENICFWKHEESAVHTPWYKAPLTDD